MSDIELCKFVSEYWISALVGVLAVYLIRMVISSLISWKRQKSLALLAKKAREKLNRQLEASKHNLPQLIEVPSQKRAKILRASATELLKMLRDGTTTSVELVAVFYQRALEMNAKFNFLTGINLEEALITAKKYDELRKKDPSRCKGLLFGLPISIKESFGQKGFEMTSGCIASLGKLVEEDALMVKLLKDQGAIPFVRTNIPQGLFTSVTTNRIWGETVNPWNSQRSAGGSSGGEGAIVASRGSPLGLGSDMGGSVRIPAAFCGIYGFKPSAGRTSFKGHDINGPTASGIRNIFSACGPLAISVADVELFCKAVMSEEVMNQKPFSGDPYLIRQPWNESKATLKESTKLRIGYVETFDFYLASKPARRAVRETIAKLKADGHEVIELKIPFFQALVGSHLKIISGDGNLKGLRDKLKGEPLLEEYSGIEKVTGYGPITRRIMSTWYKLRGEKKAAFVLDCMKPLTTSEYLINSTFQRQIQASFFKIWEENNLDAFISPGYPIPAMKTKNSKHIMIAACYTRIYNYLNLPAGSLPVTRVKEGEDIYDEKTGSKQEELERRTREDMKGTVGMPINIQVTTLPNEDEKCVAIMKLIERLIPFYSQNSFPCEI